MKSIVLSTIVGVMFLTTSALAKSPFKAAGFSSQLSEEVENITRFNPSAKELTAEIRQNLSAYVESVRALTACLRKAKELRECLVEATPVLDGFEKFIDPLVTLKDTSSLFIASDLLFQLRFELAGENGLPFVDLAPSTITISDTPTINAYVRWWVPQQDAKFTVITVTYEGDGVEKVATCQAGNEGNLVYETGTPGKYLVRLYAHSSCDLEQVKLTKPLDQERLRVYGSTK